MNKNIFRKIALMAGVALMGVGCQTDYFNEHYLPGYENSGAITDSKNFELVLSADDYAAIAKNSTNKAIAEEAGEEATAALAAIGKNKYFIDQFEAATYLPAWLDASYPTYDLNKYSEYGDYYVKLATDKTSPMYNRAFVGSFAPGSVFKPCVACAALEENVLTPTTQINCTKYYNYYSSNPVACMGYHKNISLNTAVAKSCNYYFAEAGRLLGIDTMYLYAEKFGLGEKTGLEVPEGKGFLAGRDSTQWLDGNTVQAAIGQSDNAFTPVQLATYTATIANDGVRYRTHLVKEIRNYQRDSIIYRYDSNHPEVVETVGVSQKNLEKVQQAMRTVVSSESGTANAYLGDFPVKVAAKTGTAENSGSDHTVFICYAPYDEPEVALAVVLEHGASGKYSMTVARKLLEAYFK